MKSLLGYWLRMGMPREWSIVDRIRYGREYLVRITGQDFGYDAVRWHDYLWDTNAGGYRWARRSRDKWALHVKTAASRPEWLRAVEDLVTNAASSVPGSVETEPCKPEAEK